MNANTPLSAVVAEEICLEGLEGITIDAFWKRIAIRLKLSLPLPLIFCKQMWQFVTKNNEFEFFELPVAQAPFEIFDRLEYVDLKTGILREPKVYPGHKFVYSPINKSGVMGSCEHFNTRVSLPREEICSMTWSEIENKYGTTFVIVGSQKLRESFLLTPMCNVELTIVQYCIMERIGRSRYNGETSHGKFSLLEVAKESSLLFYHRKILSQNKLITKQPLCQRTTDNSTQGMIFHLPRYYNEMKPKIMVLTEKVVNILKSKPNYTADFEEIKSLFVGKGDSSKKWFRTSEFMRHIKTDVLVPYRTIYPDAEVAEWQLKNRKEEKMLRAMQLIHPETDINDLWYKDYLGDEEKMSFLDNSKEYIDVSILQHAYKMIAETGEQGLTQSGLSQKMGLSKLNARAVVKNLVRMDVIFVFMSDVGRQRVSKYAVSRHTENFKFNSEMTQLLSNHKVEPSCSSGVQLKQEPSAYVASEGDNEAEKNGHTNLFSITQSHLEDVAVEIGISDRIIGTKRAPHEIAKFMQSKKISSRYLRRCNLIVEITKKYKVVDPRFIQKKVSKEEEQRGFVDKACNKSVIRLLDKLAVHKFLKIVTVRLKRDDKIRQFIYACDMGIDENNAILRGKIEFSKSKAFLLTPSHPGYHEKGDRSNESPDESLPKFQRMKLFHEFLYYLIYAYPRDTPVVCPEDAIQSWKLQFPLADFSNIENEISTIYSTTVDWKLFVPPLIKYQQYTNGWTMLADVVLRLPIALFSNLCTFQRDIPELNVYLLHPIRRYFLVKHLPQDLRAKLYYRRKYIFNIDELARRLCYAGLLQFGPQRMKEKDQIFLYLNLNTALLNTTNSEPGYHKIENKEYPRQKYTFHSTDDVTTYWSDLYTIAANTRLNRRNTLLGKEILIEQLSLKAAMLAAIAPQTPQTATENDVNRQPPGDGLGACGLDSAFFAHLRTNWHKCKSATNKRKTPVPIRKKKLEIIKRTTLRMKRSVDKKKLTLDKKLSKKDRHIIKPLPKKVKKIVNKHQYIRKIPAKLLGGKKPVYDEIDRKALKLMKKLRVCWTSNEDHLLLICKIAMMYFYPDPKLNTVINYQIIRDILHWASIQSLNKTSKACQRRINYMLKNETTATSVKLSLEEAKQNLTVMHRFGQGYVENLRKFYPTNIDLAKALKIHYVELVHKLTKILSKLKNDQDIFSETVLILPDTMIEFNEKFILTRSDYNMYPLKYDSNPKDINGINILKLTVLIHSAICSLKDKTSWSFQLFNIYKYYSEKVLSSAMKKVRLDKLISLNKNAKTKSILRTKFMPTTNHPYHISITYQNQIATKIPYEIIDDFYGLYRNVLANGNTDEYLDLGYGHTGFVFMLAELTTKQMIDVKIEPPQETIRFDPSLKNSHASYSDKMDRFQDIYELVQQDDKIIDSQDKEEASTSKPAVIKKEVKSAKAKITFDIDAGCTYRYPQHPIEKLIKLSNHYFHFFCILKNLHTKILSQSYKIDTSTNICTGNECVLSDNDSNLIEKCLNIIHIFQPTVNKIQEAQKALNRIDYLNQNFIIREDNFIQIFAKLIQDFEDSTKLTLQKDVGKFNDNMRVSLNILEIVDDILFFHGETDNNCWLQEYEKVKSESDNLNDISIMATAQTSLTKATSKDEITEKIHKLHDFFVVNSSKLSLRMCAPCGSPDTKVKFEDMEVWKSYLPSGYEKKVEIMENISSDAIWPEQQSLMPLLQKVRPILLENELMSEVLVYIEDAKEIGVTSTELVSKFPNKKELLGIISTLIKFKFVLRTGFKTITYVCWKYVDEWIIKTFHIVRLSKEAIKPLGSEVTAKACAESYPRTNENDNDELPAKRARMDEESSDVVENESSLGSASISRPTHNLNVCIAPWIKVNGGLNRRVLDRWLVAIVLYCLSHPGIIQNKLNSRFNLLPAFHLNYLLRILQSYGCLEIKTLSRQKVSLFSNYAPNPIESATDFDSDDEIYIDLSPDALTRLSVLIGNKKYKTEFI